jgi:hypothetical protein
VIPHLRCFDVQAQRVQGGNGGKGNVVRRLRKGAVPCHQTIPYTSVLLYCSTYVINAAPRSCDNEDTGSKQNRRAIKHVLFYRDPSADTVPDGETFPLRLNPLFATPFPSVSAVTENLLYARTEILRAQALGSQASTSRLIFSSGAFVQGLPPIGIGCPSARSNPNAGGSRAFVPVPARPGTKGTKGLLGSTLWY